MSSRDHLVQVDDLGCSRLLAAEREQPLRQITGPVGCDADLPQVGAELLVVAGPAQGELAVAHDRNEEVVEVVRDSARELPDRLELLRLPQPALELALLGHVGEDPVPLPVPGLLDKHRLVADPDDVAVPCGTSGTPSESVPLGEPALLVGVGARAIVRVDVRAPGRSCASHSAGVQPSTCSIAGLT